jgi:hypothetical protein
MEQHSHYHTAYGEISHATTLGFWIPSHKEMLREITIDLGMSRKKKYLCKGRSIRKPEIFHYRVLRYKFYCSGKYEWLCWYHYESAAKSTTFGQVAHNKMILSPESFTCWFVKPDLPNQFTSTSHLKYSVCSWVSATRWLLKLHL